MKREDLQGIRGVAVLFVLIFHISPSWFPLGFVGVDMFFVLSGFLMSMILSRDTFTTSMAAKFYERRLRRIVPLFYLVCLFVYIVGYFPVFIADHRVIAVDLRWCLSFTSNMQPFFEDTGYWDQLSAYRFFVHAWSLGVEMQFYLIAPCILGMTNKWRKLNRCFLLCVIAICSLCFQTVTPTSISYGFMFSRIWQFLLGALAFEVSNPDEESAYTVFKDSGETGPRSRKPTHKRLHTSDLLLLLLIASVLMSTSSHSETPMRIFGTSLTALIIVLSGAHTSYLLTSRALVYFGDISYSLYLIHWPAIVATKHYLNGATVGFQGNNPAILWNLRERDIRRPGYPCEPDDVIKNWTNLTGEHGEEAESCETQGTGKANILIIGNSLSYVGFPLIHDTLAGNYSHLRVLTIGKCVPIYNNCPDYTEAARTIVDRIRPDILFVMWLTMEDELTKPLVDPSTDRGLAVLQENIDYYSARSKYVVIDQPYYAINRARAYSIAQLLYWNQTIDEYRVPRKIAMAQKQYQRERIQHLTCSNCVINNVHEARFDGDYLYLYNRTNLHSYLADGVHLTSEGLESIRNNYVDVLNRIFSRLN